jgi:hypothetical protein
MQGPVRTPKKKLENKGHSQAVKHKGMGKLLYQNKERHQLKGTHILLGAEEEAS